MTRQAVTLRSANRITTPTALAFSVIFGLQPALAHTLAQMFDGRTVTTLRTHIHRLRAALDDEAIDTTSTGYCLTEIGVEECNQAIQDFKAWVSEERAA